jgi:hypothetical protein
MDEPYQYHAKLIEVKKKIKIKYQLNNKNILKLLATTAVGKEGTFMNESKLRNQFNLRYVIELLMLE